MPGNAIQVDSGLRKFVHASCTRVREAVVRKQRCVEADGAQVGRVPHGLKQKTLDAYFTEWSRYIQFATSRGYYIVPGRDAPWVHALLWDYMQSRAETCKPSTVKTSISALAHFGAHSNHLLSSTKFDSDSLAYRRIVMMNKQVALDYKARFGFDPQLYGPNRCTPLGKRAVSALFSAFGAIDESSFAHVNRIDRHNLVGCVMQHTAAMRYGAFPDRAYTIDQFDRDAEDGSLRLISDWHRYSGRRRHCLLFASFPRYKAQWYELLTPDGRVADTVSAATILHWHFKMLRAAGERTVFAPEASGTYSRDKRQAWLREKTLAYLPLTETRARTMAAEITPHSFRPGLAGDLLREGVTLERIAIICRWSGIINARMYADRRPLAAFRTSSAFRHVRSPIL